MSFQARVESWMLACFGLEISRDIVERNHRFLEEAIELVQANGCTASEAHQLVDYVYGRDQGDINQEVGGVMVTLAALCLASGVDMDAAAEAELTRVWALIDKIRAKQAAKPKHSPLPGSNDNLEIGCPLCLGDGRCPQCQGVGYYDAAQITCSMCDGTCLCPECHGHGA